MVVPASTVCGVLVTYHPDPSALAAAIAAVRPQVDALVVVDNGSPGIHDLITGHDVHLLAQPTNVGLATAQNLGIDHARAAGHSHVLILDQDSVPAADMVATLLAELTRLTAEGKRVAAVGPVFRDPREDGDAPFIAVAFPMSRKLWCAPGQRTVPADFLISSGALIPLAVLDDVGGMDDALFIDNVDMEWSFRARAAGYELHGVCGAVMAHHLGDARQVLPGGFNQVVHSPVRLYYIMRNRVRLYRLPHTPRVWTAQDLPRVLAKLLIFTVLVGPRVRNARYMLRGLADGVRGRGGPCPFTPRDTVAGSWP